MMTQILGILLGAGLAWLFFRVKTGGLHKLSNEIVERANLEADHRLQQGQLALEKLKLEQKKALDEEREKLARKEGQLAEQKKKFVDLERREAAFAKQMRKQEEIVVELERAAGMSAEDARAELLRRLDKELEVEAANRVRRSMKASEAEAEKRAASIISTAINRMAGACVSEGTVATVSLPSDEIKGRIIGREGRNIRTLENLTGVNILVDDTPGAVVISGFDPLRKHIAKQALSKLVLDGRIHPTRIEEEVARAQGDLDRQIVEMGEDAAFRVGAGDMHPELIALLGKLHFRTSYGHNILEHSLEVAHLLGMMAAELGLDQTLGKRIGLLHDVGKAVSHETEGTHALIGRDFAIKYGESEAVANGIGCHHGEIEPTTIEGSLCSAADALSGGRPSARLESVEQYVHRLKKLEEVAYEFPGVTKAYALQAGREVRVVVSPQDVDDEALPLLARDLAKRIEEGFTYPGKIKVLVLREHRATEYAV